MHHRAGVILGTKVLDLSQVVPDIKFYDSVFVCDSLEEVVLHAGPDVSPVDDDVVVPVRPALLVPEPGGVHQLMHHNTWTGEHQEKQLEKPYKGGAAPTLPSSPAWTGEQSPARPTRRYHRRVRSARVWHPAHR